MKKLLLVGAILVGAVTASRAGGVSINLGIGLPLPPLPGIVVSRPCPPPVTYCPPAVTYCPPRVAYCPPPVYCPPRVAYCPPPVTYCPPPRYYHRYGHGYGHHGRW